jgi:hypothetical protein
MLKELEHGRALVSQPGRSLELKEEVARNVQPRAVLFALHGEHYVALDDAALDSRSLRGVAEAERGPESEILDRSYRSPRRCWGGPRLRPAGAQGNAGQGRPRCHPLAQPHAAAKRDADRRRFSWAADSTGDGAEHRAHEMAAVAGGTRVGAMDHLPARRARRSGTRHQCRCRARNFPLRQLVGWRLDAVLFLGRTAADLPERGMLADLLGEAIDLRARAGPVARAAEGRIGTGRLQPADLLTLCGRSKPRSPKPSGAGV